MFSWITSESARRGARTSRRRDREADRASRGGMAPACASSERTAIRRWTITLKSGGKGSRAQSRRSEASSSTTGSLFTLPPALMPSARGLNAQVSRRLPLFETDARPQPPPYPPPYQARRQNRPRQRDEGNQKKKAMKNRGHRREPEVPGSRHTYTVG